MAQNVIELQHDPKHHKTLHKGPFSEFLNNVCYSQNFLKLWYGSKCYETFQLSHSLEFQAIFVDFKVFKTLLIRPSTLKTTNFIKSFFH